MSDIVSGIFAVNGDIHGCPILYCYYYVNILMKSRIHLRPKRTESSSADKVNSHNLFCRGEKNGARK